MSKCSGEKKQRQSEKGGEEGGNGRERSKETILYTSVWFVSRGPGARL